MTGVKISTLPWADAATDTDQLEVNQGGTSRRVTVGQMASVVVATGLPSISVANLAELKALTQRPDLVVTQGYNIANDGGGGPPWVWVEGSMATADDFMVATPTSGPAGRYIRQVQAGAAVSPKWAGCGLGAVDDSAQFLKVIAYGAAVDASGGTYPLTISIPLTSTCPGIFSDGTGVFVPGPGSTSAMNVLACSKINGFYFRNIAVVMPIGSASTSPDIATGIAFSTTSAGGDAVEGTGWEVTDCRVTGGVNGILTGGRTSNGRFCRNFVTGSWREAIQIGLPTNCMIDDNQIIDCCVSTAGGSGAIRIGGTTSAYSFGQVSVCRNTITRCNLSGQSSIDCYTGSLSDVNVSDNVLTENGAGIDLKTDTPVAPGPGSTEIYQNITVNNNTITVRAAGGNGINLTHNGGAGAPDYWGKCQNISIIGNHISCKTIPSASIVGIGCAGYHNVSIKSNFITYMFNAINISGVGVIGARASYVDISGNTIVDAQSNGIVATNIDDLRIHNNPRITSRLNGLGLCVGGSGTINEVSVQNNFISANSVGVTMNNCTNAVVAFNTIAGGILGFYNDAGATPTNVIVEHNRIRTMWRTLPAHTGTVTNPGAGLTDGTRIFTVTNGTGTIATRFTCVVSGGTITGPVLITVFGAYSTFPTVPTVTVDKGIVGGATFTLATISPAQAARFNVAAATAIVQKNTIDIATSVATATAAGAGIGTYVTADNVRGVLAAAPVSTAGSLGDTFLNSAPTAAGVRGWICTTAGTTGTAVWKGLPINA